MKKMIILAIAIAVFMEGRSQGVGITSTTANVGTYITTTTPPSVTDVLIGPGVSTGGATGADNTFVGYKSGGATGSSQTCTYVGTECGTTTGAAGDANCFYGYETGKTTTNQGKNNAYFGASAGMNYTGGNNNILVGALAGQNFGGSNNTFLGTQATVTGGSGSDNNTLLGSSATVASGLSYATAIGSDATVGGSNSIVLGRVGSPYDLIGIGTSTPAYQLDVEITSGDNFYLTGIGAPTATPYQMLVLDANNFVSVVPAGPSGAENGTSISTTDGNVVLGQDACGTGTDPAALTSTRYIPLNNNNLLLPDGPTPVSPSGEGRMGIGLPCGTNPAAKLDIYKPNANDDVTPIGLNVINNDASTVTSPFPPTGINTQTAIGVNSSVTNGASTITIGGEFNTVDAGWLSIGTYSAATCSSSLVGNGAIGGLFEATATSTSAGISNGIITNATGPFANNGAVLQCSGGSNENTAVRGNANGTAGSASTGGYFVASSSGGALSYGVYAGASGSTVNYAGYFNGDVYTTGSYLPSDEKLKSNVQDFQNSLDILHRLNVKSYEYNTDQYKSMNLPGGSQIGIMAQNMQAVLPNLVKQSVAQSPRDPKTHIPTGEDTKFLAVNYVGLIPVLVEAVKELDAKTTENQVLTQRVTELESGYATLQKQLTDICSGGCASLRGSTTDPATQPGNQLLQNVPNPFSRQTTIGYVLNTGSAAYLNINGLDGKLLKHTVLAIGGPGSVTISSTEMAPGTYTYSLYVDGAVIDTKLMVISAQD